jgi:Tfp pilus assembly protein PilF
VKQIRFILSLAVLIFILAVTAWRPQATQQLMEARRGDPKAQLWPEVIVDIIGGDYLRAGDAKTAIELFKLNLLAYPDSADAHFNLADAYLNDGQKVLAREYAEKTMAMLDSRRGPLIFIKA